MAIAIRLLITDDHPIVRMGLRAALLDAEDIEIVAEARDGREAIDLAERLAPDVILLDLSMPEMDGVEAARSILERCPSVRVLAMSGSADSNRILKVVQMGALGFVSKLAPAEEVAAAVRQVARGELFMPADLTRQILFQLGPPPTPPAPPGEPLTPREIEVLKLLAQGLSNADIGGRLFIAEPTVRTHVHRILAKLGVSNRLEAALYAMREGIATLEKG
ncbi:MAG TPA: response regulator transcription factor [Thermoanaerobaculia bacterium]